ncbi:Putative pentatricopeptide repeat-containing protein [Striga hermonthica]|uniref:Pentatricopeptide repeat-containing protein n=1 Tax=Striga hermonthica TaxID=68872 RepID=A0A9N7RRX9_STRHE|nr:Putative pentatricopeptide repeat-containing protein [Striga hermonthica]
MFLRGISSNTLKKHKSILNHHHSSFFFSTAQSLPNKNHDESRVLSQLADLLPISIHTPNPPNTQSDTKAADDFLSPEDKLRGVFLQRLCGKSAVHRALDGAAVELNRRIFAQVLDRGSLCGESMVAFFNWAVDRPDVPRDIDAYHTLLKALGRRKFFSQMVGVLNDLRDKGLSPNPETLSIFMDSYLRARQVSKAAKFFAESETYGLEQNQATLNVALRCFTRRLHIGVACKVLDKMRGRVQFSCETYNTIIGGWSKSGRFSEVEKFLKAMVEDGIEPDCITYSYIIESFGRAGRVRDAVRIFNFLVEKGNSLSVEVYNAMIFNFICNEDVEEALKHFERMLSEGFEPNIDTYVRIITCFLKRRRVADAIEMFDQMLGRGIIPPTGTVTRFIEPLCSYGPPHAALVIYKSARKAGCEISATAYKLLLARLARFGKCGMVLSLWGEMQESGYSPDVKVYECVVNGMCNVGRLESATRVMEECIGRGFFPGKVICSKLKNKLMESGKVEMAYKLFLKLRKARVNENAQRYWRAKGWHY